ncbi:MAG: N5-carboxyaminoimidazole ribonucleotide synthase [Leptospiraceae bacterium]|nr:MAG: N5-carboxyaminoimidazole ribonucleotide synthase [Leptospiraceae bacterium]
MKFSNFTIGIIGGGQLGRMLAYEAFKKGFKVAVLDPDPDAPAIQICHYPIIKNFDNEEAFLKLAEISDVITFEFENIEPELLIYYQKKIPIYPNPEILKISKNRNKEKNFVQKYNISIPEIFPISTIDNDKDSIQNLYEKLIQTKKEWIIKTSEGGYDGKYQIVFKGSELSFSEFYKQLQSIFNTFKKHQISFIIEEKIQFDYEFSLIACGYRNNNNIDIKFFPVFINEHKNGILRKTISLKNSPILEINEIQEKIKNIIYDYQYIGLLTMEFFYYNNYIYFNEMAPRPHNSGHLTIEGCNYSQFEQHIRAISHLPIHQPELIENAGMLNLIAFNRLNQNPELIQEILKLKHTYFHYYGKKEPKENRKMGHITILNSDPEKLKDNLQYLESIIY